ncbi:MAG: zinc ABC transporter substrate-binding protein [Melioribacteraceae bacterium]|nr:zinc ABC transporter substrate-binding protein [Melioribacteraceae bacterium]
MSKKLVLIMLLALLISCKDEPKQKLTNVKIKAVVSILPMKFIAEQIGKDKIIVESIIPNGSDPHTFDPSPRVIKKIHDSDIFFLIGDSFVFEKNIVNGIESRNKTVLADCSKNVNLINNDPHIWLGMDESKIIASNIASKLIEQDKANQSFYENNLMEFKNKVDSLKNIIENRLSGLENKMMLVYHPAWRYFLKPFGIKEESVEREGKHPKAGDLKEIIAESKYQNVKAIFIEEQFNPDAAKSITEELEIKVVKINPLTDNLLYEWDQFSTKLAENLN